jgi:hypothetical protein
MSQHFKGMATVEIIARTNTAVLNMLRSCRMLGHGDMNIEPDFAKMGRGARDAFCRSSCRIVWLADRQLNSTVATHRCTPYVHRADLG